MKLKVIKDRKNFLNRKKSERLRIVLNFFKKCSFFSEKIDFILLNLKIFLYRKIILKKFGKSCLKNHCIISGRARAIFRCTRMSRIITRTFLRNGLFTGWIKSSF